MITECNQQSFTFHPLNQRQVVGRFDGGAITTDAGGLLLREVMAQRVYGLALGYEDLNDHEELRCDPLLAVLSEKAESSSLAERMRYKLRTPEGGAVYRRRKAIVEPVLGRIKEVRGFRRFGLRGLEKVSAKRCAM